MLEGGKSSRANVGWVQGSSGASVPVPGEAIGGRLGPFLVPAIDSGGGQKLGHLDDGQRGCQGLGTGEGGAGCNPVGALEHCMQTWYAHRRVDLVSTAPWILVLCSSCGRAIAGPAVHCIGACRSPANMSSCRAAGFALEQTPTRTQHSEGTVR